jgi:hypothetical protein
VNKSAAVLFFFAVPILFSTTTSAQRCDCPGTQTAYFKGGDRAPLYWGFGTFFVQGGNQTSPALMCYSRLVWNASLLNVLNIKWEVAGYGRRSLPKQREDFSCRTLSGELSSTPKSGPLYHGISSQHYDTTVHPPKDGWQQAAASSRPSDLPPVRSALDVSVEEQSSAGIVIYSSASTPDGKFFYLTYEVENRGNAFVRLLVNMPIVESMIDELPFINNLPLPPKSRVDFLSKVYMPVSVQPATVLISDEKTDQGLAVDVVGVYAPIEGKRRHSDESLFDKLR